MGFLQISGWLQDVNVWLALCSDRHEHHRLAAEWLEGARVPVYFCRVTQTALLRLLTNPKVMESDTLTPLDAIGVYRELRADERVCFAHEPADIEDTWLSLMTLPFAKGSVWTDAWLAASRCPTGQGWCLSMQVCGGGPTYNRKC